MLALFVKDYLHLLGDFYQEDDAQDNCGELPDLDRQDLRVFFVPQGVSTLAQYIAMHDDLYSQNVFGFFTRNSLWQLDSGQKAEDSKSRQPKDSGIVERVSVPDALHALNRLDRTKELAQLNKQETQKLPYRVSVHMNEQAL